MKRISLIITLLLCMQLLHAQTWSEWFRQNSTQKKYLLQQIAALRVYSGYLGKGYLVARNGLSVIQQLRQGEVNLHDTHFKSLVALNPIVKKYVAIAGIISLQKDILIECKQAIDQFRNSHQFTVTEINYLKVVIDKLVAACVSELHTLSALMKIGHLQLTDDERLAAIDRVHASMQGNLIFIRSFTGNYKELAIQRGKEMIVIIISKKINAIK